MPIDAPRRALVVGLGGIGAAVAEDLTSRGTEVVTLSRSEDGLDVTDEASVSKALAGIEGGVDLIFVATGALTSTRDAPEKSLKDLTAEEVQAQVALNAIGPALVLKHWRDRIPRQGRFVFAALSARVGSIGDNGLGGWYSYRTSKAALNSLMHGAAVELARSRREAIVVCLHPGTVSTAFTSRYPDHDKVTPKEAAGNLLDVIAGLTPEDSGGFFDYAGEAIPW